MRHHPEIAAINYTDINLKCRTCGRQTKSPHLFLVVQGRRCTQGYLRTCHSQTRIRPTTTHVQRLVRPPLPEYQHRWCTVVTIHQPIPTKTKPSEELSVLVACLAPPPVCRPKDLRRQCTLGRHRPRFRHDSGFHPSYGLEPSTRPEILQMSPRSGRSQLHPQVGSATRLILPAQSRFLTNPAVLCRWEQLEGSIYALALEYEAGGVGKALFENMIVRLDFPPHTLSCHIYTIPLISKPAGATHRVRIWLKTPSPFNTAEDSHRSYTYQRIWSTDEFRVGGFLDFQDIDPKRVILATPLERPPLRLRTTASPRPGPVGR